MMEGKEKILKDSIKSRLNKNYPAEEEEFEYQQDY